MIQKLITSAAVGVACCLLSLATMADLSRPPQIVLLSFDGSKSIPFWRETRSFAKKYNLGFTYFISGVYFLSGEEQILYRDPRQPDAPFRLGRSDIGFGVNKNDIEKRVHQVLAASDEKLELASHANGHFDGGRWSLAQWMDELTQFHHFIGDVFQINSLDPLRQNDWTAQVSDQLRGFRAPLLGVNKNMYSVLKNLGYTYDSSEIGDASRWPYISKDGVWMLPLKSIRLAGTAKKTVTMDYNILVAQCNNQFIDSHQSACKQNSPEKIKAYEDETYQTYISLFKTNYFKNRAPIVIGHHFSLWNKGAYWRAIQRFAKDVCGQPEVKCLTFSEAISWFEDQQYKWGPDVLLNYQQGNFPLMPKSRVGGRSKLWSSDTDALLATYDIEVDLRLKFPAPRIDAVVGGTDRGRILSDKKLTYIWTVDGRPIKTTKGHIEPLHLNFIGNFLNKEISLSIIGPGNKEIFVASRQLKSSDGMTRQFPGAPLQVAPFYLEADGWTNRVLRGDLPEAHSEWVDENLLIESRVK